jgi:hypothetical protein
VGLYIIRSPASASRLQVNEQDGLLKYLAKGAIPNDRCDCLFEPDGQVFDPVDWIAKVTSHIPQTGAQILRYCGRYSNASRGKAGKRAPAVDQSANASKEVSESQWSMQRKATWAALIKLIYEVDPLLCSNCHSKMNIVSVIKDGKVIDKILAHLQYKLDPLPLPIRPPPQSPTEWDSISFD